MMLKYYVTLILVISFILKNFGQTIGLSIYSGLIYNHSQRLYESLGLLNDNYYKNFLYGADIICEKDKIGFKLGYYKTKFTNVLNFDGSPALYFTNKNFLSSVTTQMIYLGFSNSVIKTSKYKLNLVFGIDMSYIDLNSYEGDFVIRDSLYFEDNAYYIDLLSLSRTLNQTSFGFNISIENHYLITKFISAFVSITGRAGFMQTFTNLYFHSFTSIDNGHSTVWQHSMVANKGDFLGVKIGLRYNFKNDTYD